MQAHNINHMFQGLDFTKSASDIIGAATQKIVKVKAKIEERLTRIADLRKEHDIDDSSLIQLLQAARKQARDNSGATTFSYNKMSGGNGGGSESKMEEKTIGAGAVNFLLTENDFVEAEREQVKSLERIVRNLKPIPRFADNGTALPAAEFTLTTTELDYLGF